MFQLAPHKCTNKYQLGQIKWSIYLGITNRYTINHDIVCAVCVCVVFFFLECQAIKVCYFGILPNSNKINQFLSTAVRICIL